MKRKDHQLVQQVLDGEIEKEDFDAFQQRLRDEPELAELYEGYALLHHTLIEEFEGGHHASPVLEHRSRRIFGVPVLLAGALVLVLAALLWRFKPWVGRITPDDVAVVSFSVDAVWRFEGDTRNLGAATAVSQGARLELMQGRAGISLEPSVTAVIEGPASLVFSSDRSLHLAYGRGYFHRSGNSGGLSVTTPRFTTVDSGTEFGVEVPEAGPDELHVTAGRVLLTSNIGGESSVIPAGEAAAVPSTGGIARIPLAGVRFARDLGRFRDVLPAALGSLNWRVDFGNPEISEHGIKGGNYSAFLSLPGPEPAGEADILLVSLTIGNPSKGQFFTDGWAGLSFFRGGEEMVFFGDSFGDKGTWSLDVKQQTPVILPQNPITESKTVTLRYDRKTGGVSLHEGGVPLRPAFCEGSIPRDVRFDEIRVGASSGAALQVVGLDIKAGGD